MITHHIFCCVCFLGTAEALAAQVTQENFDKGLIYPPFTNIREISAQIAAKVAGKAYELGESDDYRSAPQICFPTPEA
jgi:malic enzyme